MTPTIFFPRTCWFCLAPDTLALRLDRKSKPYLGCATCGVHAFLRTPAALHGIAIVSPAVEQIRELLSTNPAYAAQQQEVYATFKRELLAAMAPPESAVVKGATYLDLLANDKKKVV